MSDETTPRLKMPMIVPGQAQKEMSHNDALATLDLLVQGSVVEAGRVTPPTAPTVGQAWIVGTGATGAWSGRADAVAGWTDGGWRFVQPPEGATLWGCDSACFAQFLAGTWSIGVLRGTSLDIGGTAVVGARRSAIGDVTGGTTIDSEARAGIAAILTAMRGHVLIAS